MTPQAHGFGAVLAQASERLQAVMTVVLALGLLAAVVTDGSVPVLATKVLLVAMVVPTVMVAVGVTHRSEVWRSDTGHSAPGHAE